MGMTGNDVDGASVVPAPPPIIVVLIREEVEKSSGDSRLQHLLELTLSICPRPSWPTWKCQGRGTIIA